MPELRAALSDGQIRELVEQHVYTADMSWIEETLRDEGWLGANTRYLEQERRRSAEAMRDLMLALGIGPVQSASEAVDLLVCAFQVFAPEGRPPSGLIRETPTRLRIENADCPVYRGLEATGWHGVTACPSWHRRRGWIDALGVRASDSVMAEKKWGDPACVSVITVDEPARTGSQVGDQARRAG